MSPAQVTAPATTLLGALDRGVAELPEAYALAILRLASILLIANYPGRSYAEQLDAFHEVEVATKALAALMRAPRVVVAERIDVAGDFSL